MKKLKSSPVFWTFLLLLIMGSMLLGQRRQRAPWAERSPKIGKVIPEFTVYDKDLKAIPLSNLYKDSILIIQWGGCT